MYNAIESSKNDLKLHQRGVLFQAGDSLGKIPGIGAAIGAIRTTGSILAMFGAGFVYGGAYCFKNETLKETCLFVHERAIDETIRGIYEIVFYGVGCEKLTRKVGSMLSSEISSKGKNHDYFAHGSRFTVDSERRIRYYSKEETFQSESVAQNVTIKTAQAPTKPLSPEEERKAFVSKLLNDMEKIHLRYEDAAPIDPIYL